MREQKLLLLSKICLGKQVRSPIRRYTIQKAPLAEVIPWAKVYRGEGKNHKNKAEKDIRLNGVQSPHVIDAEIEVPREMHRIHLILYRKNVCREILRNNKQITSTCNNTDHSHKPNAKWKKTQTKVNILEESMYTIFWNRRNWSMVKTTGRVVDLGGGWVLRKYCVRRFWMRIFWGDGNVLICGRIWIIGYFHLSKLYG